MLKPSRIHPVLTGTWQWTCVMIPGIKAKRIFIKGALFQKYDLYNVIWKR
jgi:hypothetical protein